MADRKLIRAQAYLDAKQTLTTRTGKNSKGKLKCTTGNKQCGGRCIPQSWDCRLEGKGTNSELKSHQQDIVGGVSSIKRGIKTIVKNPADPEKVQRGRDSIIRGIVKTLPGDDLETKKQIKRRLQKDFNRISTAVVTGALMTAGHAYLLKNNKAYRLGIGGKVDRAAWGAVNEVINRTPVLGARRRANNAAASATITGLGRAISKGNTRDRLLATRGLEQAVNRRGALAQLGGQADFGGTNITGRLNALQQQARDGKLNFTQWSQKATQEIFGSTVQRGNVKRSVFSEDAANRLLANQFGIGGDLPAGTLQGAGKRIVTPGQANLNVVEAVGGKLQSMSEAMRTDMRIRRFPTNKSGGFDRDVIQSYVDTVALPKMGLVRAGMSAQQQKIARRQATTTISAIINGNSPKDFNGIARQLQRNAMDTYDTYFAEVAQNMSITNPRDRNYLLGDGSIGAAKFLTQQQPIRGERPPARIVSRDHARLILRDYYERKVMGDTSRTFVSNGGTVQRVAAALQTRPKGAELPGRAESIEVLRNSGIRSLTAPNEAPKTPRGARPKTRLQSSGRARSSGQAKGLKAAQTQTALARKIMQRKGFEGSYAEAMAQARREMNRKDAAPRIDDEHTAPMITKRNPPRPLATNSVQGEHLPATEAEMTTPLMPVSEMSQSPSPKEAEEQEPTDSPPVKLSISLEIPASALKTARTDAYEAEKIRLRQDYKSGGKKGTGKKCGESHIPQKHECLIGKPKTEGDKPTTKVKGQLDKTNKYTTEGGGRSASYRAKQLASGLARAGFTVGTAVLAGDQLRRGVKNLKAGKDGGFTGNVYGAAGFAMLSVFGAKSINQELKVTKSNKDLINDFSKLRDLDGVESETVDQLTKFVQDTGIDVQRTPTNIRAGGILGYWTSADPNRIRSSVNPKPHPSQRFEGYDYKMNTDKNPQKSMTQGVQTMVARRAELYNDPEQRSRLIQGQSPSDIYEFHSNGGYVGNEKGRSMYTNVHEMGHAIHYRGDFRTPKSVTVKGKVYEGAALEAELLKSTGFYGQSDMRRSGKGKAQNYYQVGGRLETYAENYAMYVSAGKAMKTDFPVAYEWTKQTTDYALSQPPNKPARTFQSAVDSIIETGDRPYIGDRMDAPMFSGAERPKLSKNSQEMKKERDAKAQAKAKEEPQLKGDELFVKLYEEVKAAAIKGDTVKYAELIGQAEKGDLDEPQMQMLGDFAETTRMYEIMDGRDNPNNESKIAFNEPEDKKAPAKEEKEEEVKTDARREAYLATRAQWR